MFMRYRLDLFMGSLQQLTVHLKDRAKGFISIGCLILIIFACQNPPKTQEESVVEELKLVEKPAREPHQGFEWVKVSGAGIEFWAQKSDKIQIGISETLPGAFVERIENGKPVAVSMVIQVFNLENGKIEDVFEFIKDSEYWNEEEQCAFEEVESRRKGVDRYVLRPTGKALQEYKERASSEPITHTCGIWGMGNSGIRYFEIHHNNRSKALFIDIGQEAPLFDEESIIVK
jgi:hypothetical protein